MELSKRRLEILSAVIRTHIDTGEPVGSKAVSELLENQVSSATIRNEMAVLGELGFLEQPHTSAGRVPSHIGYRLYVDRLMKPAPLSEGEKNLIDSYFNGHSPDPEDLIRQTSRALAGMTGCVAVSTALTAKELSIETVDVLRLSRYGYLLVMVTSTGCTKTKRCQSEFDIPSQAVVYLRNFLFEQFRGRKTADINAAFLQGMAIRMGEYSLMFTPFLLAVYELCRQAEGGDVFLEGETNLFSYSEFVSHAGEILRFLEDREKMGELLLGATGQLNIQIGREIREDELADSTMILAGYQTGRNRRGRIGVIGPKRIDYEKVIPQLQYFAAQLAKWLSEAEQRDAPLE